MHQTIRQFIQDTFRPQVRDPKFGDDTPLFTSGIIDSFGVLELIAFLEDTFAVSIDPGRQEITDFDTVSKIAVLIQRLRSPQV